MLKTIIFSFKFFRFIQTGFYFDYFFKKIIEIFIKNFFIYSSIFFGEKFIIEYFTKKYFESFIFNSKKSFFIFNYINSFFFVQLLTFIFFFLSLVIMFF